MNMRNIIILVVLVIIVVGGAYFFTANEVGNEAAPTATTTESGTQPAETGSTDTTSGQAN